jgi:hypothetical protein
LEPLVAFDISFDANPSLLRHVLIDFREDGVTPFATVWKHGFREVKV